MPGFLTFDGVVPTDHRAVTIALNQDHVDEARFPAGNRALDIAVCAAP